ncbi:trypsin-like peptidase domain-containing protein [Candidatus Kaiserbacteria bacterium]|nr:trypsin-like peptidase domain-containing protein [Candidatus Kaiserbacteria bacterium]
MDIEQLSKSQIVLLTLLVSFVTSIATGIVTVSLMDQAPPIVAQTVNRVIERTVETVAADSGKGQTAATIVTQEKTVVVKESDQISQAVEKVSPSLVRMYTTAESDALFLGMGIVLDAGGTIVTDSAALGERAEATLALADGSRVRAFVTARDADAGLAFLRATSSAGTKTPMWTPAKIAADRPVLGASVVAISGKTIPRIASGLVTALIQGGVVIDTNVSEATILDGSPLIDTSGNIVGVSTSVARASSGQGFITASVLLPAPLSAKK